MKRLAIILLALAPVLAWAYAPPTAYKKTADRVFTNVGEEVELQARLIDGKPNPLFTKYRNASSRVWTKNGDDWEVVWRRKGVLASEQVMATGVSSCKALERQPVYVRVRIEEPNRNEPTDPALEVLIP